MNAISNIARPSIPHLPAPLADALTLVAAGLPKRERTRAQLLLAAIQVFAARGVAAATMQEIAAVAGMTTGTVYNHFSTREEVVQQVGLWLAHALCQRITDSQQDIPEGAERMAIGNRRYLWLAEQSPAWALLLLDVAAAAPEQLLQKVQAYALADLRLGVKQGDFHIVSEAAAMDLINGTVTQAMRSIALGLAPPNHATAIATTVLRGLGMAHKPAQAVARRPLPPLQAPVATPVRTGRARRTVQGKS